METIWALLVAVLCTLMLPKITVSHLPFKNLIPIINVSLMPITTDIVCFTVSFRAGQMFLDLVDGSYQGQKNLTTRVACDHDSTMGRRMLFGSCWCLLHQNTLKMFLRPISRSLEIFYSTWLWILLPRDADTYRSHMTMLMSIIFECPEA